MGDAELGRPSRITTSRRGERRLVTALAADLTGYTALCSRLDPEDVVRVVQPVMEALHQAVEAQLGLVVATVGDGLFAVFGVPRANEDDAVRALRSADAMRAAVVDARLAAPDAEVPDVHIGVAAGEVLAVPQSGSLPWSLTGPALNLAARLCALAGPGEVLVDEQARLLAAGAALWTGQRLVDVRGLDEPVVVSTLALGPTGPTLRPRHAFIGRAGELDELDKAFEDVAATAASRVLRVTGDAGIGKSRLVEEWLIARGIPAPMVGSCAASGVQSPLQPLALAVLGDAPDPVSLAAQLAADGVPEAARQARRLVALALENDSDIELETAWAALRQLLEIRANSGPAVVVLDDVHNASAPLRNVLGELREMPLPVPLLLITISRPDASVADLVLEGMVQEEARTLLAAALGADLGEEQAAALVARADGNPLYLVHTAAWLRDAEAVVFDDDGSRGVVRSDFVGSLPDTLRAFIAARLDSLPAADRELLQRASAATHEFGSELLRQISPDGWAASQHRLLAARLLSRTNSGRLTFSHPLVREVAYSSLTREERAHLHAMQLRRAKRSGDVTVRAYHAERWALATTPANPLRRSAIRAALSLGVESGLRLHSISAAACAEALTRLLPLIDEAPAAAAARLLTLLSRCQIELAEPADALEAARRAIGFSRRTRNKELQLECRLAQAEARSRLLQIPEARRELQIVISEAGRLGRDGLRGLALEALAFSYRFESWSRFRDLAEEAHRLLSAAGDLSGAARTARTLAYSLSSSGDPALQFWLRRAEQTTQDSDIRGQAMLARIHMFEALWRHELDRAFDQARHVAGLARECGDRNMLMDALCVVMETATGLGLVDEALAAHATASTLIGRHGSRMRFVVATSGALALLRAGRVADCLDELRQAEEISPALGTGERSDLARASADVALDRGQWEQAKSHASAFLGYVTEFELALGTLHARLRQLRVGLAINSLNPHAAESLVADCKALDAPVLASYAEALLEQAQVRSGWVGPLGEAQSSSCLEELAVRAETKAFAAELDGEDATDLWEAAAAAWAKLGKTIWHARALEKAGRKDDAAEIADAIEARISDLA